MDLSKIVVPEFNKIISGILAHKRGKGVRRLAALVESYIKMAAAFEADGKLEDHEIVILNEMGAAIIKQFNKLSG